MAKEQAGKCMQAGVESWHAVVLDESSSNKILDKQKLTVSACPNFSDLLAPSSDPSLTRSPSLSARFNKSAFLHVRNPKIIEKYRGCSLAYESYLGLSTKDQQIP
ncbi:unnamed protein product [Dovyalis caffra]|uniref:Uncharacterized protein n=1 Tax=Dovyalis caffra TaxID=77055 RepID=A0AAV1RN01_9ROSI|nr:unnamed protein product [Dovyalis caffra]